MADYLKKVIENVDGEFYVDTTCIDCGTCRHLAPAVYHPADNYSYVAKQPETEKEMQRSLMALLACPTGSIGTVEPQPELKAVRKELPLQLTEDVWYLGFTSSKSYGASSYFLKHPQGNWLVDSPKYLPVLVEFIETQGGIDTIFLTHRDDVAEAHQYAVKFGAKRVIHKADLKAQPEAEIVLEGEEAIDFQEGFKIIPVPGHSPGSCCLLVDEKYLFSGDHCWWNPKKQQLGTPTYIYWDKEKMAASHEKLMTYPFDWVFPGHGMGVCLSNPDITF